MVYRPPVQLRPSRPMVTGSISTIHGARIRPEPMAQEMEAANSAWAERQQAGNASEVLQQVLKAGKGI